MRRKYILGLLIIGLVLFISGITYAYLRVEKVQDNKNAISAIDCLNVALENEEDVINLKDAFPITDNDAFISIKPYKFTVRNTCPNNINAEINLESLQVNDQLSKDYVKIEFTDESANSPLVSILGALPDREPIITNATSDNLTTVNIKGYGEKSFTLRLWIDYNTTLEQGFNKYYEGKIAIKASPNPIAAKVYGVRRDIDSSSSAWERIGASVNLVANAQIGETAVQNDFDNIYPWSDIISYNYKYDSSTGNVTEIMYGEDGFAFDGTNGEVLTRIPEFYYNRYQQTEDDGKTYEYVLISPEYIDGYYKSEAFSVGRYTISGAANDVHSKSGVQPLTNVTITDFRNYIRNTVALGDDFGQMDYHYFILQLLYLVEYADYNSQAKLGQGNVNNTVAITSGECNTLGMKSGTYGDNDKKHSVTYRGIEDIFGNVWQYVDGINIKEYVTYICTDQTQYAVDTFTGCYKPVGYTNLNMTQGYPSKLGYDADNPLVATPIASGGSDSTYISNYYWSGPGNRTVLVGGGWLNTSQDGLWLWNVINASSHINTTVGARLLRAN